MANGLDEFKSVLTDFSSVASNAAKLAVIFPLADIALKIGPPFPKATPFITSLLMLLVFMLCFHFGFGRNLSKLNKTLIFFISLTLLSAGMYFSLYSAFVREQTCGSGHNERQVQGYSLNSTVNAEIKSRQAAEVEKDRRYFKRIHEESKKEGDDSTITDRDIDAALEGRPGEKTESQIVHEVVNEWSEKYKGDPSMIWTQSSVTVISMCLLILWVVTFACMTTFIALFVLVHRQGKSIPSTPS